MGGCTYGVLILGGVNPLIAILCALVVGIVAGFVTSSLVTHIGIEPVFASIITLTALQTFIIKLSSIGKILLDNLGESKSALSMLSSVENSIITIIIVTVICLIFFRIMNSEYGLAMRVYGDGKIISESLGINSNQMLWVGLGLGNALSAIAGALIVQISGKFCATMGNGSLVFGLAAVIIGDKIISPKTIRGSILGCLAGAFVYKILIDTITWGNSGVLGSEYNSIITAIMLIFLMASIREKDRRG
jgi:putative ABC transport system permease protein